MRGIVSLAAALALPAGFPYRDLILLTVFSVVVGTLVIQGLTLKPLLRALDLRDDDPVGREVRAARGRALEGALASVADDRSPAADLVRREFTAHLRDEQAQIAAGDGTHAEHRDIHRDALQAARQAVLDMRARDEIGDDAFHRIEEELDWFEMAGGGKKH
jgi:CPA1 family monovalent cation:H+ antiporter